MDSPPDGVVPATRAMALRTVANLAPDHLREIADTGWFDPETAVLLALRTSLEAYAFMPDGREPVFLMGVERPGALTGAAMVWMVGTAGIRRTPAVTLRAARWGVRRAFAATGAAELEQYIPAWYDTGLRFVFRLGFRPEPTGMNAIGGDRLLRVVLERKDASWERLHPSSPPPHRS